MAIEIERKFLLDGDAWRAQVSRSETMVQGYLAGPPAARCSVRVRIAGEQAFLNIKSIASGITRDEYEYVIPLADAQRQLDTLAGDIVQKKRHYVGMDGLVFEIDEFGGANAGLIVAEIELGHVDAPFPRPAWLGREVSSLARYYNLHLAAHPYSQWSDAERAASDAP
ncbi:MAG: CYTH domain-containing protein [Dokdonella sp.]|uniref:CYTH domain-containing protein n=1 Tax=Dokdonella sp. TaxID=2291710 RepID=UPI00326357DF